MPTLLKQIKAKGKPEYRNVVKVAIGSGTLEYVGSYLIMHPTERFRNLEDFVAYVESTILHMDRETRRYLNRLEYKGKECIVFEGVPQLVRAKQYSRYNRAKR